MEPKLCFIRESYFLDNMDFVKMLDCGNPDKQAQRTHLCVLVEMEWKNWPFDSIGHKEECRIGLQIYNNRK